MLNTRPAARRKLSVSFIVAPNFTLLAFSAFIDTLRLAADDGDRSRPIHCEWALLSHDMRPVKSSCGVEITPTTQLDAPARFDYIVVVGGLLHGLRLPTAQNDYLRAAAAAHVPLVGICTGSFALARLGLMQGRRSCVSWYVYDNFRNEFPDLEVSSDELFIDDTDRLTCAGGTSVVHLAAFLVERHCDKARAAKALRIMIEHAPLPAGTPQPQPLFIREAGDFRVRKAMLLIERHLSDPLPAELIAQHVNVSVRHLERLFQNELGTSPLAFAFELRLNNAYNLLITTRNPIIDIALQCGFLSNSHFSRCFRSAHGKTPSQVREQESARKAAPALVLV
ncbi:GlxA family transcriptional regulator [Janthinobacterium sp. PC23-8]|uniref:GlxA family transcriptional regulator n=1 Tax=Janthinobacterium sp. PC23-8 TaxID=2012679 RepID=UPI001C3DDBE5|nr:GlxA family transcriptional regulator [Janthinobacterium sp. PC23-8]